MDETAKELAESLRETSAILRDYITAAGETDERDAEVLQRAKLALLSYDFEVTPPRTIPHHPHPRR